MTTAEHVTETIVVGAPIERAFEGWESMHAAVGSSNGWLIGLERFAHRVSSRGDDA
jgi:hypothetical protein